MRIRTFFGGAVFLTVLIGGLTALDAETSVAPEPGDLRAAGTVDFKVSCAPEARSEFIRGVALLHSFFYEEARRIFTAVAAKDPNCAMAYAGHEEPMARWNRSSGKQPARVQPVLGSRSYASDSGRRRDGWGFSSTAFREYERP